MRDSGGTRSGNNNSSLFSDLNTTAGRSSEEKTTNTWNKHSYLILYVMLSLLLIILLHALFIFSTVLTKLKDTLTIQAIHIMIWASFHILSFSSCPANSPSLHFPRTWKTVRGKRRRASGGCRQPLATQRMDEGELNEISNTLGTFWYPVPAVERSGRLQANDSFLSLRRIDLVAEDSPGDIKYRFLGWWRIICPHRGAMKDSHQSHLTESRPERTQLSASSLKDMKRVCASTCMCVLCCRAGQRSYISTDARYRQSNISWTDGDRLPWAVCAVTINHLRNVDAHQNTNVTETAPTSLPSTVCSWGKHMYTEQVMKVESTESGVDGLVSPAAAGDECECLSIREYGNSFRKREK